MKFKIKQEPIDEDENDVPSSTRHRYRSVKGLKELESPDLDNEQEQDSSTREPIFQRDQHLEPQISNSLLQDTSRASTSASYTSSSIPASQSWPGEFDFTVSFSHQEKNTKGVAWTYSPLKDKLYVGKDAACPINFSANAILPDDVFIRVMAVYTSPGQVSEIVHRCVNHSLEEQKNGIFEAEHLIRCESSTANYHVDPINGRHSVVVPFENPPDGQEYTTCIYKFACFGSCAGGPNRRPLMLIFTLERAGNQVIGRRKLDVKICACPGRDRKIEEGQLRETEPSIRHPPKRKEPSETIGLSDVLNFTNHIPFPRQKKPKSCPNRNGFYVLEVEDKGCYDFLLQMKHLFEMCKMLTGLSPDVAKTLNYFQRQKNEETNE